MAEPIVNLPFLYAVNGQVSWTSATALAVAAGQFRDSTNTYDLVLSASTINAANNGLGGLDTGDLAASTQYQVYVIADSTGFETTGVILSASATAPTMPAGYDIYRLITYWMTDSSEELINGYVLGATNDRTFVYQSAIEVIAAQSPTTLTAYSLASCVPAINNSSIYLVVEYTPANVANLAFFTPGNASAATNALAVKSTVVSVETINNLQLVSTLVSGVPKIKALVSASDSISAFLARYSFSI